MVNKKAFSLVEIIIAISIITLLAVVGYSSMNSSNQKADNTKVMTDISTIKNALEAFSQENNSLPMPGGNTNFYKVDTSYAHSYTGSDTFGVYGVIDENTLPKKYLDNLPLDPRTNSYYSYGKTKSTNQFEVASVLLDDDTFSATVDGNYSAENGPYNLIRSYNGPDFVSNGSETNLPYNPNDLIISATANGIVYHEGQTIKATSGDLEIFFSDGSVSVLEDGGEILLSSLYFKKNNNTTTYLKLALKVGKIWTKATHLNEDSEFQIYTDDTTAAVRGTIFSVEKTNDYTEITVKEGTIYALNNQDNSIISKIYDLEKIKIKNNTIFNPKENILNITIPLFSLNNAIRNTDEINNLIVENQLNQEQEILELEEENLNNCYLNGTEIENNNTISAYNVASVAYTDSCPAPIFRKCEKGVLDGSNDYKYEICKVAGPNQCLTYTNNGFVGTGPMNFGDTKALTLTTINNKILNRNITCNDNGSYSEIDLPFSCETGYQKIGDNCGKIYTLYANASFDDCSQIFNFSGDRGNHGLVANYKNIIKNKFNTSFFRLELNNGGHINADSNYGIATVFNWVSACKHVGARKGFIPDTIGTSEYLSYEVTLPRYEDFKLELKINVPSNNVSQEHYVVNLFNGNVEQRGLYIKNNRLYFTSNNTSSIDLSSKVGQLVTINLENNGSNYQLKATVDGINGTLYSTLSSNVDKIYVGVTKDGTDYKKQLDSFIDNFSIYK